MFGGQDSHLSNRYSRQHTRFQNLQHSSRCTFSGDWNAPLPHRSRKSEVRNRTAKPSQVRTQPMGFMDLSVIDGPTLLF